MVLPSSIVVERVAGNILGSAGPVCRSDSETLIHHVDLKVFDMASRIIPAGNAVAEGSSKRRLGARIVAILARRPIPYVAENYVLDRYQCTCRGHPSGS